MRPTKKSLRMRLILVGLLSNYCLQPEPRWPIECSQQLLLRPDPADALLSLYWSMVLMIGLLLWWLWWRYLLRPW